MRIPDKGVNMSIDKLRSNIETVAAFYEGEGLVREAYNIDVMLNTFDQKVAAAGEDPDRKTLDGYVQELLTWFKKVMTNVENNVEKLNRYPEVEKEKLKNLFRIKHREFIKGLNGLEKNLSEVEIGTQSIFTQLHNLIKNK